ncbi:MAG: hypothetical protein ACRCSF_08535 [Mycobacteriaceae bacterium]
MVDVPVTVKNDEVTTQSEADDGIDLSASSSLAESSSTARISRQKAGLLCATVTVIFLALSLVIVGYKYWDELRSQEKTRQSSEDAVAAASAFMTTVLSMDTANLGDYKNNLDRMTTGDLKERLLNGFDSASAAAAAGEVKATGKVVAIAPEQIGETEIKVIVFAEQSGTNSASGGQSVDSRLAVRVLLEHVDGQWLAKDVESL